MNGPVILGLGTAVPEHRMSQREAAAMTLEFTQADERRQRVLEILYRKSGVRERRTSLPHGIAIEWQQAHAQAYPNEPFVGPSTAERMEFYEELAFPLAAEAVAAAMENAHTSAAEITHLVTVSCTGFYAPGVDVQLMRSFNLQPTTQRVHVGFMGCHGALNALRVSQGMAALDPSARILLCAVELCCLHYRFRGEPEQLLGNVLFADGAAAAVLGGAVEPNHGGECWQPKVAATSSCLIPESTNSMTWKIGSHGFEMSLASTVPDLIKANLRGWLTQWLCEQGLSVEGIQSWVVHPGGPRILSAVEESLALGQDRLQVSREVLSELGNMSSPTVMFILERLRKRGSRGPAVMLGFGPGLVAEAVLLR